MNLETNLMSTSGHLKQLDTKQGCLFKDTIKPNIYERLWRIVKYPMRQEITQKIRIFPGFWFFQIFFFRPSSKMDITAHFHENCHRLP